jgi:two-component sensor histidine kinase/CheY-like chemotaxis protein
MALKREREREQRAADGRQQQQLIAELDHRVKNTLAMIRSLVLQGRAHAGSLESFVHNLEGRIRALAHAHELLTAERWQGGSLRRILEAELAAHQPAGRGAVEIRGTDATLRPKAVIATIMVVHELVANAVLHGALSRPEGRVLIEHEIDPASGGLLFRWHVSDGPPAPATPTRGLGATLIERTIRFDLGGTAELRFEPAGVAYDMLIPSRHLLSVADQPSRQGVNGRHAPAALPGRPAQERVLIVEDQMIVALDLEGMVQQLGYHTLGPASTVEEAKGFALGGGFDFAILDINLNDRYVFEVADLLAARNVPFCFATGYGRQEIIPPHLREVTLVTKPYDVAAIRGALETLRRQR